MSKVLENEIFKAYIGFNIDYFKIGQLIKITVRDSIRGMFIKEEVGFIKYFDRDSLVFMYIDNKGEEQERTIVPADLTQKEVEVEIKIIEKTSEVF